MRNYQEFKGEGIMFIRMITCPYCNKVLDTVKKAAISISIFELITTIDTWPMQYKINYVPAFLYFKNNQIIDKIEGVLEIDEVKTFLEKYK